MRIIANIVAATVLAWLAPEPEEYRYKVLPDALIFLDGLPSKAADLPAGSDVDFHTADLKIFGRTILNGPIDKVFATSPKKEGR
jgi:hypothetical protein